MGLIKWRYITTFPVRTSGTSCTNGIRDFFVTQSYVAVDVHKGVVRHESENLDGKSVVLLQTTCDVSDSGIFVTTKIEYLN